MSTPMGRSGWSTMSTGCAQLLRRLSERHEVGNPVPWRMQDLPEPYLKGMLKGIVGLDIAVTRLEGKYKLSQNRPAADRPARHRRARSAERCRCERRRPADARTGAGLRRSCPVARPPLTLPLKRAPPSPRSSGARDFTASPSPRLRGEGRGEGRFSGALACCSDLSCRDAVAGRASGRAAAAGLSADELEQLVHTLQDDAARGQSSSNSFVR